MGSNVNREPPEIRCKKTFVESPTDSNVRPSGDKDAKGAC